MAFLIPDNDIWIIGSSIITHAEEAAYAKNQGDLQLGGRQVLWFGSRGMHWYDLRPKVQWEMLNRPPLVMLVIHVGGGGGGMIVVVVSFITHIILVLVQ